MRQLELHLLGRPQVLSQGQDLAPQIGAKALAVLAFIALGSAARLTREKLAGTFWSDKPEPAARYRLRHTLWELRKVLGEERIQSDNIHCWLDADGGVFVDAFELQRGCANVGLGTARYTPCPEHAAILEGLVRLYRGDLLQDLSVQEAPLFEEWLLVERERWHLLYQDILWNLGRAQQAAKDYAGGAQTLARLIEIDPLRERNHRALMGLYFECGDSSAALRIYRQCSQVLAAEMGISPSPETERVRALIVSGKADPVDMQLKRATELCQQKRYSEAWTACAAIEALAADPVSTSQVALVRAEIALLEGKGMESLRFVQAARQTLTRALRG